MKKILIASTLLNILLVGFTVFRFLKKPTTISLTDQQKVYAQARKDVFNLLPIDSTDIVFVGDSMTEGFPVGEMFGAKNRGISGNRSYHVLDRIYGIAKCKPKKIFLMIGVNDIKDQTPIKDIMRTTTLIIDSIKRISPGTKLYVQSVLPARNLNDKIVEYNKLLKSYCESAGVTYIDLYPMFNESLTYDGLHLTAKGYEVWRDEIKKYL